MKKYFTGTLDQLQVDFLPSHIHIAFMEYFLSTLGIFFGTIALTLSKAKSQRSLITNDKNIKTPRGTQ